MTVHPVVAHLLCWLLICEPVSKPVGEPVADPVGPAALLVFEPYCLLVGGDGRHSLGDTLDAVGDVDGDGVTDLAAFFQLRGPSRSSLSPFSIEPWIAVLSGATLSELWSTHLTPRGRVQRAVSVDDLDGDGLPDIALAGLDSWNGDWVEWRSGRSGAILATHRRPGYSGASAHPMAQGADVDGDGRADLVVGCYGSVRSWGGVCRLPLFAESGVVEIVSSGRTPSVLASRTGGRCFGRDVCLVGDVTGDGLPEIVTFEMDPGKTARAGRVLLLSGDDLATLAAWPTPIATFNGRLAPIGDIDGDGLTDLVLAYRGSWGIPVDVRPASVAVLSGANLGLLRTHTETIPFDSLSHEATDLGDLDGDGRPEYALVSRGITPMGREAAAARSFAQVHSGRTGDLLGLLRGLPEHAGWVEEVVPLGDVDGDGRQEIALGLGRYTVDGEQRGAVLVVSATRR